MSEQLDFTGVDATDRREILRICAQFPELPAQTVWDAITVRGLATVEVEVRHRRWWGGRYTTTVRHTGTFTQDLHGGDLERGWVTLPGGRRYHGRRVIDHGSIRPGDPPVRAVTRHQREPPPVLDRLGRWLLAGIVVLVAGNAFVFWSMWRHAGVLGVIMLITGESLIGLVTVLVSVWDEHRRCG